MSRTGTMSLVAAAAVALGALGALAACADAPTQAPVQVAAATMPAVAASAGEPKPQLCHKEAKTGSNLGVMVCRPAGEEGAAAADPNRHVLEEMQRNQHLQTQPRGSGG